MSITTTTISLANHPGLQQNLEKVLETELPDNSYVALQDDGSIRAFSEEYVELEGGYFSVLRQQLELTPAGSRKGRACLDIGQPVCESRYVPGTLDQSRLDWARQLILNAARTNVEG